MRFGAANEYNLVVIGDSQTAKRDSLGGATLIQTFPFLIAKQRGYGNVWNAGVAGDTTTQMLARFSGDVLAHHSGAVAIMGGINDMASNITGTLSDGTGGTWTGGGISYTTTKSNVKTMIQNAQAQHCRVTVITPYYARDAAYYNNASSYITALSQAASETGAEYMDLYSRLSGLSSAYLDTIYLDFEHPNAAGHAYIASMANESTYQTCFSQL